MARSGEGRSTGRATLLGGIIVVVLVCLIAVQDYQSKRSDRDAARAASASTTAMQAGWPTPWQTTTCHDFTVSMTPSQRLTAGESMLDGNRSIERMDEASNTLVARFVDRVGVLCGRTPKALIESVADAVYGDDPSFAEPYG